MTPTPTRVRCILRTSGAIELLDGPVSTAEAARLIDASTLDVVSLRQWGSPLWVMLVDDTGLIRGLPINPRATLIYAPYPAVIPVCGDVVIVPDDDFAGSDGL